MPEKKPLRIVYSFPHKLGAGRICYTAWEQVNGLAKAGGNVTAFPGVLHRPVHSSVRVQPTLAWGKLRVPYKLFGTTRACALHDYIVSKRIEKMAGQIDIIHTWALGAKRTLQTAKRLGIPTVLERPNAHTRFAYHVVEKECARIGVPLPPDHEHAYNPDILRLEEEEYQLADALLCPSDFVVKTFLNEGFTPNKLVRHIYGFDEKRFHPDAAPRDPKRPFTMISVGVCAVRKGLHFALEAWLQSPASRDGLFLIAGDFLPAYREKLAPMLAHPSVKVLGHRNDIPELMRQSDVLVLPSIEEGFGLVVAEAMGSGCVPLISDACTDIVSHDETGLIHEVANIEQLQRHITYLYEHPNVLKKMSAAGLAETPNITWGAAGESLMGAYREVLRRYSLHKSPRNDRTLIAN